MDLISHLILGEPVDSGAVAVTEYELRNNYCIYLAEVVNVDYDNSTVDVEVGETSYSDVPFFCHTDIDYFDKILDEQEPSGVVADYFASAAYTLPGDDYVLLMVHNEDTARHFAVPRVTTEFLDTRGNCPGTTYWMYSVVKVRTTLDSDPLNPIDKYLVWNLDKDEEAKVVNEAGDGLVVFPCDHDEIDAWINQDITDADDLESRDLTITAGSSQQRCCDIGNGTPGETGCSYWTGSGWSYTGVTFTSASCSYNSSTEYCVESTPHGAFPEGAAGQQPRGSWMFALDWFAATEMLGTAGAGFGDAWGRVTLSFRYGSTPYATISADAHLSISGYYGSSGSGTIGTTIGDVSFSGAGSCTFSGDPLSVSQYSSELDQDADAFYTKVEQKLSQYRSGSVFFYGMVGYSHAYSGSWSTGRTLRAIACTSVNFEKVTEFNWDFSGVLTPNAAMTAWINDHFADLETGLVAADAITINDHEIVVIKYDERVVQFEVA